MCHPRAIWEKAKVPLVLGGRRPDRYHLWLWGEESVCKLSLSAQNRHRGTQKAPGARFPKVISHMVYAETQDSHTGSAHLVSSNRKLMHRRAGEGQSSKGQGVHTPLVQLPSKGQTKGRCPEASHSPDLLRQTT